MADRLEAIAPASLTQWEEEFVDSVSAQFDRSHSVSDRQMEILERIYNEKVLGEKPSRRYE